MKKLVLCIMIIAMIAVAAACGKNEDSASGGNNEATKAAEATKPAETTPEPTATTAPTPDPVSEKEPTVTEEPAVTEEPTAEPTTEPTATETPEPTPAEDNDISELVGSWYEVGSVFSRTINISAEGAVQIVYEGSGMRYGSVIVRPADSGALYYYFLDTDGKLFAETPKKIEDGIIVLDIANEGRVSFKKDDSSIPAPALDALEGSWVEEDVEDGWNLTLTEDGSWTAYRNEEVKEGYARVIRYGLNDIPYAFSLRTFDGGYWTTVVWDWNSETIENLNALDLGENGTKFRRFTSEDEFPSNVPGDEYVGNWQNGRCSLSVYREGAGAFIFEIIWANSASEWDRWSYWTFYSEENKAFTSDGMSSLSKCTYDYETGEENAEVISNEESAVFTVYEDKLIWHDNTGKQGDLEFERMPVVLQE